MERQRHGAGPRENSDERTWAVGDKGGKKDKDKGKKQKEKRQKDEKQKKKDKQPKSS